MSDLDRFLASCLLEIDNCDGLNSVDAVRMAIFGKNGKITEIMKSLKNMSPEEKREFGRKINNIKEKVQSYLQDKTHALELDDLEKKISSEFVDVFMPVRPACAGRLHPLSKTEAEVSGILASYGFRFADGPEIESEYMNFTALNMPDHHPARTMHDTFYINVPADKNGRKLLRTHTSPMQIRAMLQHEPPLRFFSIGRVFRSDYDATHTPMFSQIEGLMVDVDVGFSHLKWLMADVLKQFFQVPDLALRFRTSFFPFTEPSAEVDINYEIKDGKVVFGTGDKWMEIGGAGVVHPAVLRHGNVDASKYQGIAFGFGLERLTTLKYGVPDLRGYFESDDRWRNAFGFS
ncbi:MAG: phenylalanine--tRNA ligase subunit alpha, partial [Holosporaceae bacterium]|nr:phenylalanine--tRNA ligase subunit alpha [Holosporaceae bacterium]